jgi:hypothetical protein
MEKIAKLPDDVLLERIERFVEEERERLHTFLALLAEIDLRGILVKRGYSSTFDYCVRRLKLSEDEAYRRINAARATVLRPELLSAMSDGRLSLSAVTRIAPHVRRSDAPEIISRAEGKTMRELSDMLAPLRPVGEKRDVIRAVAVRSSHPTDSGTASVELLVDFGFRGTFALREAIDRAKELLSHRFPHGGMDEILTEIVNDYLRRHDPRLCVQERLAPVRGSATMPAAVRRTVWSRDGGRCVFVGPGGIRCQSRKFLEIDHIMPRARGGRDTADNLRLLCRAHNDAERRRILGEGRSGAARSAADSR